MTEEKSFSIDIPLSSLDSRWHWAFRGILTALKVFLNGVNSKREEILGRR
jgi:hypothetical protein